MKTIIDLEAVCYYFSRDEGVDLRDLKQLSEYELTQIVRRYPYSMAVMLKYGHTDTPFPDKLRRTYHADCYFCGKFLDFRCQYEYIHQDKIEFICPKCYLRDKMQDA